MTRYVSAVVMVPHSTMRVRSIMIRKIRPDWQKGLLNFPGGKVELTDKTLLDAINREIKEELGCRIHSSLGEFDHFAAEIGPDYRVDFFRTTSNVNWREHELPHINDVGEKLELHPLRALPPDTIGNCQYIGNMAYDWRRPFFAEIKVSADVSQRPSW